MTKTEARKDVAVFQAPRLPWHDAIAERYGSTGVNKGNWRALIDACYPQAQSADAVLLVLQWCQKKGFDPFDRPCHIVPMWSSAKRAMVETVWPGIAALRITAWRTKLCAGIDAAIFGPDITREFTGEVGKETKTVKKISLTFPEWAQVVVYRLVEGQRVAIAGPRVYWEETYAAVSRFSELPNEMWERRKRGQLEKCFSPDTEVLTDCGFQPFPAVTGRIMEVTARGIEPTDAKPFRQFWDGPMIAVDGRALNFCVTPNHDMLTTDGKIEAGTMFAQATSVGKFRIPVSAAGQRQDAPISDRAIRLTAAFVCDGYKRPYDTFCIALARPYKVEMLESIGEFSSRTLRPAAGNAAYTDARVIVSQLDKTVFSYDAEVLEDLVDLDKVFDREALLSLSSRQAKLLVDTMVVCDGANNGHGTMRFYSSRLDILAAFEIAAVAAGYAVSHRRTRLSDIGGPNYYVTISDKNSLPVLRYSSSQNERGDKGGITRIDKNQTGDVWCCRVPSGVIVVRRAGFSMLCGNCAEAAALRRAFPEEIGNEYAVEEMAGKEIHDLPVAPAPAPERVQPPQASAAVLDALVEAEAAQGFDPETGEITENTGT